MRKSLPTIGSKPFAENYFQRFKGPLQASRYGTLALARKPSADVARSRARQATVVLIRVMEWLDGPGVRTPCELRVPTHLSRADCQTSVGSNPWENPPRKEYSSGFRPAWCSGLRSVDRDVNYP